MQAGTLNYCDLGSYMPLCFSFSFFIYHLFLIVFYECFTVLTPFVLFIRHGSFNDKPLRSELLGGKLQSW